MVEGRGNVVRKIEEMSALVLTHLNKNADFRSFARVATMSVVLNFGKLGTTKLSRYLELFSLGSDPRCHVSSSIFDPLHCTLRLDDGFIWVNCFVTEHFPLVIQRADPAIPEFSLPSGTAEQLYVGDTLHLTETWGEDWKRVEISVTIEADVTELHAEENDDLSSSDDESCANESAGLSQQKETSYRAVEEEYGHGMEVEVTHLAAEIAQVKVGAVPSKHEIFLQEMLVKQIALQEFVEENNRKYKESMKSYQESIRRFEVNEINRGHKKAEKSYNQEIVHQARVEEVYNEYKEAEKAYHQMYRQYKVRVEEFNEAEKSYQEMYPQYKVRVEESCREFQEAEKSYRRMAGRRL